MSLFKFDFRVFGQDGKLQVFNLVHQGSVLANNWKKTERFLVFVKESDKGHPYKALVFFTDSVYSAKYSPISNIYTDLKKAVNITV